MYISAISMTVKRMHEFCAEEDGEKSTHLVWKR